MTTGFAAARNSAGLSPILRKFGIGRVGELAMEQWSLAGATACPTERRSALSMAKNVEKLGRSQFSIGTFSAWSTTRMSACPFFRSSLSPS
jgi:hypothetical protein